jgi:hypothetical protein
MGNKIIVRYLASVVDPDPALFLKVGFGFGLRIYYNIDYTLMCKDSNMRSSSI